MLNTVWWHRTDFDLGTWEIHSISYGLGGLDAGGVSLITGESYAQSWEKDQSLLGIPSMAKHRLDSRRGAIEQLKVQCSEISREIIDTDQSVFSWLQTKKPGGVLRVIAVPATYEDEQVEKLRALCIEIGWELEVLPPLRLVNNSWLDSIHFNSRGSFSQFRRALEKAGWSSRAHMEAVSPVLSSLSRPAHQLLLNYAFETKDLGHYKSTRNSPGYRPENHGHWSELGQPLSMGLIHPLEVGQVVYDYHRKFEYGEDSQWLVVELLWRDYFSFLSEYSGFSMFTPQGTKGVMSPPLRQYGAIPWPFPSTQGPMVLHQSLRAEIRDLWSRFRSWALATTGEPLIDASAKELYYLGKSTNRSRQWLASFLVNELVLPWWWGALWFEYCLIDYDPASNWGNWNYLAGVGTDPRGLRHFNLERQALLYDPDGAFIAAAMENFPRIPENALPLDPPEIRWIR